MARAVAARPEAEIHGDPQAKRPQKFARLRGARRVWAIGAIHGEAQRLIALHDQLLPRLRRGDRVVYLGNYLGHGDAVGETVDELLDFRRRALARAGTFACDIVFLRGAQEEMWHKLLQLQFAADPRAVLNWMVEEGIEPTLRAYGGELQQGLAAAREGPMRITRWTSALRNSMNAAPGHTTLFASLRHAALTDESGVLFVHAAVNPARSLHAQGDAFWWGRGDILDLSGKFAGFRRVVRGFDRQGRGPVETDYAVSLDAGAGRGGALIAGCLEAADGKVIETLEA